jgi:hypothetical protein
VSIAWRSGDGWRTGQRGFPLASSPFVAGPDLAAAQTMAIGLPLNRRAKAVILPTIVIAPSVASP